MSSTDATAGSGAGGAGAGASGVASGAVKLWIHNAAQVVAVTGGNDGRVGTAAMNDVRHGIAMERANAITAQWPLVVCAPVWRRCKCWLADLCWLGPMAAS